MQNWISAILAFFIELGPPADLAGFRLGKTIPSTILVSSMVPPNFLTILMSLKSTLVAVLASIILSTESTAKGERCYLLFATTLEDKQVLTHSI